jgi:hypothetical protein
VFGAAPGVEQVTGEGMETLHSAFMPELDLCVMNPPFTRSVGGNLLFGSLPDDERAELQKRLKKLVSRKDVLANSTAGLGSVFVAVADPYIKPGGRLALVLPKALLSGVAWGETRKLINRKYQIEYLVASQDAERWNFSESTDLSEVLLVARKRGGEAFKDSPVVGVNLWRNPMTSFEALAIAQAIITNDAPDVATGQGALDLTIGKEKVGEAIALPWSDLMNQSTWMLPCAFAQSDLVRIAYHLSKGNLWYPGQGVIAGLKLTSLGELGSLGPDRRGVHNGFKFGQKVTTYPTLWGHDAKSIYTLNQEPNGYLTPLSKAKKGYILQKVENLWPQAATVLLVERLRVNTQKLTAVRVSKPVLSNVWWPFSFKNVDNQDKHAKALVLWLNSTLGLILLLSHREETEGAWIGFKKFTLQHLPVLDVRALNAQQLDALAAAYDELAHQELQPFPRMNDDPVRAAIDQRIADALGLKTSKVLETFEVSELRAMLSREPVVGMKRI